MDVTNFRPGTFFLNRVRLLGHRILCYSRITGRSVHRLVGVVASGKSTVCQYLGRLFPEILVVDERDYTPIFSRYRDPETVQRMIWTDLVRTNITFRKVGGVVVLTSDHVVNVMVFMYRYALRTGRWSIFRRYRRYARQLECWSRHRYGVQVHVDTPPEVAWYRYLLRERLKSLRGQTPLIPWVREDFEVFDTRIRTIVETSILIPVRF